MPTVKTAKELGETDIDEVTARHVADTISEMLERSKVISDAVKSGKLAVVGANYKLALGEVHELVKHGDI
jgi:carbonic anhydrase